MKSCATLMGLLLAAAGTAVGGAKVDVLMQGEIRENDATGTASASHTHAQGDVTGLTAALAGKAATADVTALQARAGVIEQNLALQTWDLMAHLGSPGTGWVQAWTDACQLETDMATHTNAYRNESSKLWSTVTPGDTNQLLGANTGNFWWNADVPNAFDDNPSTYASTGSGMATMWIDLGEGGAKVITGVTLTVTTTGYCPKVFALKGWNTAPNYNTGDVLHSVNEAGDWSTTSRRFNFTNTTAYRYYGMSISDYGSSGGIRLLSYEGWPAAAAANITLQTITSTAAASPTTGGLFLCLKPIDSIGAGNLVCKLSKDGLANSTTLTMAKVLTIGAYEYWYGEGDYPAGTGTTMQAEIQITGGETPVACEVYRLNHTWR